MLSSRLFTTLKRFCIASAISLSLSEKREFKPMLCPMGVAAIVVS
jgi:hypothetical protein